MKVVKLLVRMSVVATLLLSCVSGLAAESPDSPVLRIEVQPQSVTVGESAQLKVTILGPTWFPKPPVFPSFEIPNAVVRLPPDSSGPTSAQVNGERWSGVTRSYQVIPLVGATYLLGGGTMQVTMANPGGEPLVTEVAVPEVRLTAEVPAGAQSLAPYIAGSNFRIWREIEGDPEDLQVGDALVVRYVAELIGMPAIFLPPLAPQLDSPILSVYAEEPVLNEAVASQRSERTTLVMNYGGNVTLPAVSVQWWNKTTNQVELASIEAMSLQIDGPAIAAHAQESDERLDWRHLILALLLVATSIYLSLKYLPILHRWRKEERARYLNSEKFAFDQLRKACQQGENRAVYTALVRWQQKLCPELPLRQFAGIYGDGSLLASIETLSALLYSGSGADFSPPELLRAAGTARAGCLVREKEARESLIPGLNPG